MARTRAPASAKDMSQTPGSPSVQTAPSLRRSSRSTRATQPVHDVAADDEDNSPLEKPAKGSQKKSTRPQEVTAEQSPPRPRYDTRLKQVQLSEDITSGDKKDVELLSWPRYKDDLPNAFNGEVDPSKDFISKAPLEIIDNILSFLVLDHDPERGVKMKEGNHKPRPHVLVSMSAMSRLFYHATEGFAHRFLKSHHDSEPYMRYLEWKDERAKAKEEERGKTRRSSRLADKPQLEVHQVYRTELVSRLQYTCGLCLRGAWKSGKFANTVAMCNECEISVNGPLITLTDALKTYDLRDYMLMKSRKPGPRAKFTDLPAIPYGSEYKTLGFPVFKAITVFYFRRADVRRLATLVHGDWSAHMVLKAKERFVRGEKLRTKRVRKFIIEYHEREVETSKGKVARKHQKRKSLRAAHGISPG